MNVYDFDKTIYKKDSTIEFYKYCLKKRKRIIKYLPYQIFYYILFKLLKKDKYKSKFFVFLKKIENIDHLVKEFWENEKKNLRLNIIKKNYIVISASPLFLIEDICLELGAKKVIATKVNKENGDFLSCNCHGEMKLQMLKDDNVNINL